MSSGTPFHHDAFVYQSDDEYVRRAVRFLREGLEAGEGAMVANARAGLGRMREALGADADRVTFVDTTYTYTHPARALSTYHRAFRDRLRDVPSVRAVADMRTGPPDDAWDDWTGYEALCNVSYAHLPVWVVCTYDANGLPDPILDSVWRTHSKRLEHERESNDRFEDPSALLRELTREPEPLPDLRSFSAGPDGESFRERLARELAAERVPETKALEMLVAGTEIAANAMRHGGGIEEVRAGRAEGRFVCEVIDRGHGFDDPMAGYLVPREGVGAGLWVARQLAWRLEWFHAPAGFTVRMWL
ncbi:MAG TPA: sensor histidine kinase [Thermoleophilaceae bacterium]